MFFFFFFQAEDGIRDYKVTGVQTCALPIFVASITTQSTIIAMMVLWVVMLATTGAGLALLLYGVRLDRPGAKLVLRFMVWSIPLPFAAAHLGWLVREVGRQPWAGYGLLRTSDAGSPLSPGALV